MQRAFHKLALPGLLIALAGDLTLAAGPNYSKLVHPGADGKLVYVPYTEHGDVIPDFSHCGYGGGGVKIPDVTIKVTLEPDADTQDDAPRLQAAIDQVA
ncbi:MAG: hypothetical protein M3347_12925 [Armatimonadota bacterium]|nr:hypothetical protein [Armatimonadota bacterium]